MPLSERPAARLITLSLVPLIHDRGLIVFILLDLGCTISVSLRAL